MNLTPLLFDALEIGAERWYDIEPSIARKNKKATALINELIRAAKDAGDNPSKWWVTRREVDLKFCKNLESVYK